MTMGDRPAPTDTHTISDMVKTARPHEVDQAIEMLRKHWQTPLKDQIAKDEVQLAETADELARNKARIKADGERISEMGEMLKDARAESAKLTNDLVEAKAEAESMKQVALAAQRTAHGLEHQVTVATAELELYKAAVEAVQVTLEDLGSSVSLVRTGKSVIMKFDDAMTAADTPAPVAPATPASAPAMNWATAKKNLDDVIAKYSADVKTNSLPVLTATYVPARKRFETGERTPELYKVMIEAK